MEKRVSKVEALPRLASEFRVAAYARVSSEKDGSVEFTFKGENKVTVGMD